MDALRIVFALALVVALCNAADLDDSRNARILKYDYKNDGNAYFFEYLTSDGQSREEKGHVDNAGDELHAELVVEGSYSYTGPDGVVYTVHYTADRDGFHPSGEHIDVPPYTPWPTAGRHDADSSIDSSSVNKVQRPVITNAYIPSTPGPKFFDGGSFASDINEDLSRGYIPSSTPGPFSAKDYGGALSGLNALVSGASRVTRGPRQKPTKA